MLAVGDMDAVQFSLCHEFISYSDFSSLFQSRFPKCAGEQRGQKRNRCISQHCCTAYDEGGRQKLSGMKDAACAAENRNAGQSHQLIKMFENQNDYNKM